MLVVERPVLSWTVVTVFHTRCQFTKVTHCSHRIDLSFERIRRLCSSTCHQPFGLGWKRFNRLDGSTVDRTWPFVLLNIRTGDRSWYERETLLCGHRFRTGTRSVAQFEQCRKELRTTRWSDRHHRKWTISMSRSTLHSVDDRSRRSGR